MWGLAHQAGWSAVRLLLSCRLACICRVRFLKKLLLHLFSALARLAGSIAHGILPAEPLRT